MKSIVCQLIAIWVMKSSTVSYVVQDRFLESDCPAAICSSSVHLNKWMAAGEIKMKLANKILDLTCLGHSIEHAIIAIRSICRRGFYG